MLLGLSPLAVAAASSPIPTSGGPAPTDLWPLTGMGAITDWDVGENVVFISNPSAAIGFAEPSEDDSASLDGAAETAFNAAIANSTAYSVTLTAGADDPSPLTGTAKVVMKGGSAVDFVFDGTPGQEVQHTVTSGAGSGFDLLAGADFPLGFIVDVEIMA